MNVIYELYISCDSVIKFKAMHNKIEHYGYFQPIYAYLIGLLCIVAFYYPTAVSMYDAWVKDNSIVSHGLLLLPLSIYFLGRELKSIYRVCIIKPRVIFIISLAGLSLIWFFANIVDIEIIAQVSFVLIFSLYTVSFFGLKQTGRLNFPILILLTSLPFWAYISPELQRPTAYFANLFLQVTGFTSINEGIFIKIPEGVFEVSETCSGVRYQVAAITLALLYIYIHRIKFTFSLMIVIAASVLAFLSNVFRIYIVILSGHYSNMSHSLLNDHIWLGWVIFTIMILIYMISLSYLVKTKSNESNIAGITQYNQKTPHQKNRNIVLAITITVVACMGSVANTITEKTIPTNINMSNDFVLKLNTYSNTSPIKSWDPQWRSADIEIREAFYIDQRQLDLYVSLYFTQEKGKEVINNLNNTHDKKRWKVISEKVVTIEGTDLLEIMLINRLGEKRIVWKAYIIGEFTTTSEILAKIYGVISIFKGRQDAAVVLLSSTEKDAQEIDNIHLPKIFHEIKYDIAQYLDSRKNY